MGFCSSGFRHWSIPSKSSIQIRFALEFTIGQGFFPTLSEVGRTQEVNVLLALRAAPKQRICDRRVSFGVPNHRNSRKCPTAGYPCSA